MLQKLFTFILAPVLFCQFLSAQNSAPQVIPALREWTGKTGYFQAGSQLRLVIEPSFYTAVKAYAETFAADLRTILPAVKVSIRQGTPAKGDIFFKKNNIDTSIKKEGYILSIADHIAIEATEPIGAFWATRTILQIMETDSLKKGLPKGIAKDYPQFPLRGFVLDCGRKFFSINFLRNYVKLMSYYKMNDFQIHLNDNGFKQFFGNNWDSTYSAFRLENTTYPNLTAKDGSYTKKEFIELQSLARSYGVNIVPEIDVPAHSLAFAKAVPEIGSKKYGMDHLDLDNPKTMEVIDNVFKEYLSGPNPVFTGPDVHIGTDEYSKNESEKFRAFTDHYIRYVEGFGKKVRVWGALTHAQGKTPVKSEGVTMNLWYNGYADPKEMLRLGYDAISTPDGWLYIVPRAGYYYDYLNVKRIYEKWTPNMIGNQEFEETHPQIKGGSFAVWNDHVGNGITEKDVHDRAFPAFQVLAEKMWGGKKAAQLQSYESFAGYAKKIGEGPGLNIAGKVTGNNNLVLFYPLNENKISDKSGNKRNPVTTRAVQLKKEGNQQGFYLKGGNSFIKTPVTELGYNYTASFRINPDAVNDNNAIIFSAENSVIKLKQQHTSKLGFSREHYDYHFDYIVPSGVWSHIVITGNNKGTSLYVNGKLVERLENNFHVFSEKDKIAKVETVFFPLEFIGSPKHSFRGYISDVKIFNRQLSDKEIADL